MQDVVRFWIARGVDGFRLDALDRLLKDAELRDDPVATGPPPLPLYGDAREASSTSTRATRATSARRSRRCARPPATRLLVGEVYVPDRGPRPLPGPPRLRVLLRALPRAVGGAARCAPRSRRPALAHEPRPAGVGALQPRLPAAARTASAPRTCARRRCCCSRCPGSPSSTRATRSAWPTDPGHEPPYDRAGRDRHRHPMQWDGTPPAASRPASRGCRSSIPRDRNVAGRGGDAGSLLALDARADRASPASSGPASASSTAPRPTCSPTSAATTWSR